MIEFIKIYNENPELYHIYIFQISENILKLIADKKINEKKIKKINILDCFERGYKVLNNSDTKFSLPQKITYYYHYMVAIELLPQNKEKTSEKTKEILNGAIKLIKNYERENKITKDHPLALKKYNFLNKICFFLSSEHSKKPKNKDELAELEKLCYDAIETGIMYEKTEYIFEIYKLLFNIHYSLNDINSAFNAIKNALEYLNDKNENTIISIFAGFGTSKDKEIIIKEVLTSLEEKNFIYASINLLRFEEENSDILEKRYRKIINTLSQNESNDSVSFKLWIFKIWFIDFLLNKNIHHEEMDDLITDVSENIPVVGAADSEEFKRHYLDIFQLNRIRKPIDALLRFHLNIINIFQNDQLYLGNTANIYFEMKDIKNASKYYNKMLELIKNQVMVEADLFLSCLNYTTCLSQSNEAGENDDKILKIRKMIEESSAHTVIQVISKANVLGSCISSEEKNSRSQCAFDYLFNHIKMQVKQHGIDIRIYTELLKFLRLLLIDNQGENLQEKFDEIMSDFNPIYQNEDHKCDFHIHRLPVLHLLSKYEEIQNSIDQIKNINLNFFETDEVIIFYQAISLMYKNKQEEVCTYLIEKIECFASFNPASLLVFTMLNLKKEINFITYYLNKIYLLFQKNSNNHDFANLYLLYGIVFFFNNKYEKMKEYFGKAIDFSPTIVNYRNFAVACELTKDNEQAMKYYELAKKTAENEQIETSSEWASLIGFRDDYTGALQKLLPNSIYICHQIYKKIEETPIFQKNDTAKAFEEEKSNYEITLYKPDAVNQIFDEIEAIGNNSSLSEPKRNRLFDMVSTLPHCAFSKHEKLSCEFSHPLLQGSGISYTVCTHIAHGKKAESSPYIEFAKQVIKVGKSFYDALTKKIDAPKPSSLRQFSVIKNRNFASNKDLELKKPDKQLALWRRQST